MSRFTESGPDGYALVARKLLSEYLPSNENYYLIVQSLLKNRDNTQPSEIRSRALNLFWRITANAARFGVANMDVCQGFSQFSMPPIPSTRLIETGIITDPKTIRQIEVREKARKKRGKGLSENSVTIKAADNQELELLGMRDSKRPVLLIQEYYTVTLPKDPSAELDKIGRFVFFLDNTGAPTLLFLGETQEPHAHALAMKQYWRIDKVSHPHFRITENVPLPPLLIVESPIPATDDQIATLFVLTAEGIKESQNY